MFAYLVGIGAIVCIIVIWYTTRSEPFATRQSKAAAAVGWFRSVRTPTYVAYRDAMDSKSNIVEFEYLLALYKSGKLSVESASKIV